MAQKQKTPQIIDTQLFADETLYWWGQPIPSYVARRVNFTSLVMPIFIIIFAIGFIIFSQNMFADMRSPSTFSSFGRSSSDSFFETIFPLFFLLVPLLMIGSAGWTVTKPLRDRYLATKTYYALTDKRAFIIVESFSTSVNSYYDEQMKQLEVKHYGDGVGDIIFSTKTMTRTYHQGKQSGLNISFGEDGPKVYGGRRQHTVSYDVPEGFFAVPDVRTVEDFIAQIFFNDEKKT